ncbi:hypothetical protein BDK51DRAFT_44288 [Blyttiomyces helicus]|uniref:Uncharacterized protein n=1 Tax=Blyttiomyces helicus TaxID=388810 RepID=A0A4P9WED8_9FUNG|nr:hypothetical protein BDK51DRAFT_44288 [Blyttiomyces helicus]|eukprot:RKO89340.1 hypothetical protein BDK51DRAFT_44288 [Blyttiomyces helicus]
MSSPAIPPLEDNAEWDKLVEGLDANIIRLARAPAAGPRFIKKFGSCGRLTQLSRRDRMAAPPHFSDLHGDSQPLTTIWMKASWFTSPLPSAAINVSRRARPPQKHPTGSAESSPADIDPSIIFRAQRDPICRNGRRVSRKNGIHDPESHRFLMQLFLSTCSTMSAGAGREGKLWLDPDRGDVGVWRGEGAVDPFAVERKESPGEIDGPVVGS